MSWLESTGADADFDSSFALRPDLHEAYRAFYALFWQQRLVDPVLLEIARLRIAQLNGCTGEAALRYRPAIDAGLGERQAAAAVAGGPDDSFSPLQEACLTLAEKFVSDVHAITDDDVALVRDEIGERALVALVEAMALFDGFTRFRSILSVDRDPEGIAIVDAPGDEATVS